MWRCLGNGGFLGDKANSKYTRRESFCASQVAHRESDITNTALSVLLRCSYCVLLAVCKHVCVCVCVRSTYAVCGFLGIRMWDITFTPSHADINRQDRVQGKLNNNLFHWQLFKLTVFHTNVMQSKQKAEYDSKYLVCMAINSICNPFLTTQVRFIGGQIWTHHSNQPLPCAQLFWFV